MMAIVSTLVRVRLSVLLMGAVLAAGTPAAAATVLGGISFDDSAFADSLVGSTGSWNLSSGTLASVMTGADPNDYGFCFGGPRVCTLTLAFTDNVAVNGLGADLAIFELGAPDSFELTIGATTLNYLTAPTGDSAGGFSLNAALIDLNDFGLAPLATVSSFTVGSIENETTASFTAFGAFNNGIPPVPEPATAAQLALGGLALGLAAWARRRRD